MRSLGLALLLALAAPAAAREVKITLHEKGTGKMTHFALETRSGASRKLGGLIGVELRQLASYRVRDRRLVAGGRTLADADEVLYQCRVDGTDVVVVRARERTLSSPGKILSACGGNPVEASVVSVLLVEGGEVARSRELARAENSHAWTAAVLE